MKNRNIQALPIDEQLRNRRVAQLMANKRAVSKPVNFSHKDDLDSSQYLQALQREEKKFEKARANYDKR